MFMILKGHFLTYDPTKTEGVAYAILKRLYKRFELCVNIYPLDTPKEKSYPKNAIERL